MSESTEDAEFPPEALREPRKGDPLTLTTLRSHIRRCADCDETLACPTGRRLINVFEHSRHHFPSLR